MKDTTFSANFNLNCKGKLTVYKHPIVMGIINATPDSFYSDSRKNILSEVINIANKMIVDGAEIIDIGGYSSRPGADQVSTKEEIRRVIPVIKTIRDEFPDQLISIDTFRTDVAEAAISAGANMINDITGGLKNDSIYKLAAAEKTPYIMMHMQGNTANMHTQTEYNSMISDMIYFFSKQITLAQEAGLNDIILDIGIGFSKTIDQNYTLIKHLADFSILDRPLLIGVSRKSLIYKTLNITPEEALNGSTVLHTISLMNGANILRVHDVKEAVEAVRLFSKVQDYS